MGEEGSNEVLLLYLVNVDMWITIKDHIFDILKDLKTLWKFDAPLQNLPKIQEDLIESAEDLKERISKHLGGVLAFGGSKIS